MEELLSMTLDHIDEPEVAREKKRNEHINKDDHYEVECYRDKTILVTNHEEEARKCFHESQGQAKAILHIRGVIRNVLLTNAPFMYPYPKQYIHRHAREEESHVAGGA